jgi:hypothetical protein
VARLAALLLAAAAGAAHAQGAPGTPRTVTVTATPGRLAVAESVAAGPVTFQLVNRTTSAVSAQLLAVREDHTPADAARLVASGQRFPDWIVPAGGVGPVAPGGTMAVTHSLPPGGYVLASTVPDSGGALQLRRGYVAGFRAAGPSSFATVPGVSMVVMASRNSLRMIRVEEQGGRRIELVGPYRARPLQRGEQIIEIETGGGTAHELVLVRMDSTALLRAYVGWFAGGQRGRGPGRPAGGVGLLPSGRKVWLRPRLEPGTYWLYCTATHGGRRGWELGEYVQIAVR